MRREVLIIAVGAVILIAILAVFLVVLAARRGAQELPASAPNADLPAEPAPPPPAPRPAPAPMESSAEGVAAAVAQAVERVVRPGNARVTVIQRGGARWACILVASPQRYYDLDQGLALGQFPALRDGGFQPVPPQMVRATTSICRSVARTAMGYDAARGDRILIVLCPRDEWPKITLVDKARPVE